MARPSKTAGIDYKLAHDLTTGLLERAVCTDGLPFVLLKDSVFRDIIDSINPFSVLSR